MKFKKNEILYTIAIKVLVVISLFATGCATVILENEDVLSPRAHDSLRFDNPTCIKLDFKTDNIGFFNDTEGVKPMGKTQIAKVSSGLTYYNIIRDCATPVAEYTIVFSSKTKNWWARSAWATLSLFSLGIIPFYVHETGTISIIENNNIIIESEYEEKRLTSIFAYPKWIYDNYRSVDVYHVDFQRASIARKEAALIKAVFEKKAFKSQ